MPSDSKVALEPRKTPTQARSTASVEAILSATVQVLQREGKERLTTTTVAARAGVSVGTLYQYFPNKSSLLQAALERHLNQLTAAIECVCKEQQGRSLEEMATAVITVFFAAKMRNPKESLALYSVSSDLDGARIARQTGERSQQAIVAMFKTAAAARGFDPSLSAAILQGAMIGVSRRLLESGAAGTQLEPLKQELIAFACAYLRLRSK